MLPHSASWPLPQDAREAPRSRALPSLQLLVTYRDSDLTKDHALTGVLADLRRLEGVERIALQGLAVEDVEAMTAAAAGHDLDPDGLALAREIAAETGRESVLRR